MWAFAACRLFPQSATWQLKTVSNMCWFFTFLPFRYSFWLHEPLACSQIQLCTCSTPARTQTAALPVCLTLWSFSSSWQRIISTAVATEKWPPDTRFLKSKHLYPSGSSPWWNPSCSCACCPTVCLIPAALPPVGVSQQVVDKGRDSRHWLWNSQAPIAVHWMFEQDSNESRSSLLSSHPPTHPPTQPSIHLPPSFLPASHLRT